MKEGGGCKALCVEVWVQVEHPGVIALKGRKARVEGEVGGSGRG